MRVLNKLNEAMKWWRWYHWVAYVSSLAAMYVLIKFLRAIFSLCQEGHKLECAVQLIPMVVKGWLH